MKGLLDAVTAYVNRNAFKDLFEIPSSLTLQPTLLAAGEYNINYLFTMPHTLEKLILRLNTHSQMGLNDQITYEYMALDLLNETGRTPKAFFIDSSKSILPYGVLMMAFLEGRPLQYTPNDLKAAVAIFSDIHGIAVPKDCHLLQPTHPAEAMLEECTSLLKQAEAHGHLPYETIKRLWKLLSKASQKVDHTKAHGYVPRIINTEVNSSNFILGDTLERSYLIDWEKPLISDNAQDLGHFLAPTTTFWKTDSILSLEDQIQFVADYQNALMAKGIWDEGILDRTLLYIPLNCLRGLTWCAMAYGGYMGSDKLIKHPDSLLKIKAYLSPDFIEMIDRRYFE